MSEKSVVNPDDHAALTDELDWAVRRPFGVVFEVLREDEPKYPILARVVKAVVGKDRWKLGQSSAADEVMAQAIDKLDNRMTGREPGTPIGSEGNNEWRDSPDKDIAYVIFGFRDEDIAGLAEAAAKPKYQKRLQYARFYRPKAAELAGLQGENKSESVKRMIRVIREDLAHHLLVMEKTETHEIEEEPNRADYPEFPQGEAIYVSPPIVPRDIPFVQRASYATEFSARLARGDRVIPFVGEPGNGKSRLADWLIEQHRNSDQSRVDLRAHDRISLRSDLVALLERRNITTLHLAEEQVIEQFALWLREPDAPNIVFIDNLEEADLFERLVPPDAQSRVIVSSRENRVPARTAQPIVVKPMEEDEAQQLARQLLPSHSDTDIVRFAAELGERPLAIVHAATGLLSDGFLTVDQFCRAFERDAGSVMQRTKGPEEAEQTLTWIYRRILERFRQLDRDTESSIALLLELVAFVAPVGIPSQLLADALKSYKSIADVANATLEFQAGQRELCGRYLLSRDTQGEKQTFSIHPLTQQLLRSIITKEGAEVELCLHLHEPLQRQLKGELDATSPRFTSSISNATKGLLLHVFNISIGIRDADTETHKKIDFGHTVAVLIRGFRDIGELDLAKSSCWIVPAINESGEWQEIRHMYEAILESLRLRFDIANISGVEYGDRVNMLLHLLFDEPDALGEEIFLGPMRMLELVETIFDSGNCESALEGMRAFDDIYPNFGIEHPAGARNRLMILGEIYSQRCLWNASNKVLNSALSVRTKAGPADWEFVRDDMRALTALVDNALYSNNQDQMTKSEKLADELWSAKPEGLSDSLTEGRYAYIKARCGVNEFARWEVSLVRDGTPRDLTKGNRMIQSVIPYFLQCENGYAYAGKLRDAHRLRADAITLYYLVGGPSFETGKEYIHTWFLEAQKSGHRRFFARFFVAVQKIRLLMGLRLKYMPDSPAALEAFTVSISGLVESPYIYADLLALSIVYDKLYGRPIDAKLDMVRETYESIGRSDRFAALEASLSWLGTDTTRFVKDFTYLLLP
ncbi:ATP-binding protein [Nocardia abscessus]|uniref:ATP-binding protein n=1 Tax=Nocardia abscessus TaxID=120957 RepID=UPI002453D4DC|nr:ATP-binding protein [Nocardia abscessus]